MGVAKTLELGKRSSNGDVSVILSTLNLVGVPLTFRTILEGSSAVSGSVSIYAGSIIDGIAYYDSLGNESGVLNLSGTNLAVDSVSLDATGNSCYKLTLSGLSGSTTARFILEVAQ